MMCSSMCSAVIILTYRAPTMSVEAGLQKILCILSSFVIRGRNTMSGSGIVWYSEICQVSLLSIFLFLFFFILHHFSSLLLSPLFSFLSPHFRIFCSPLSLSIYLSIYLFISLIYSPLPFSVSHSPYSFFSLFLSLLPLPFLLLF